MPLTFSPIRVPAPVSIFPLRSLASLILPVAAHNRSPVALGDRGTYLPRTIDNIVHILLT